MRKAIVLSIALSALLLAALCAGLTATPAFAKSYEIKEAVIDARIQPNGDVRVHEERTFAFSGPFTYVYWDYETKGSNGIFIDKAGSSRSVYSEGMAGRPRTYTLSRYGDSVRVQLNFSVENQSVTFFVDYTVYGAAKRWSDTSEFYWKLIGDKWDKPVDRVRITVHPPKGVTRDQVRAWAHGPLWGDVAIQPNADVTLVVDNLPAETFVEARLLFPVAALSKSPAKGAAENAEPREQAVLAEEQKLADEANHQRSVSRLKAKGVFALGLCGPLLALLFVGVMFWRNGREPHPQFSAQYLREIPESALPPALVGYLVRQGTVESKDAVATLLDLVNRGVLTIERVTVERDGLLRKGPKEGYQLSVSKKKVPGVSRQEHRLINLLFRETAGSDTLMLDELKKLAKKNAEGFSKGFNEWKTMVGTEGESRDFLDEASTKSAKMSMFAAIAGGVCGFVGFSLGGPWWFIVLSALSFLTLFLSRYVKRRTQEGPNSARSIARSSAT